ncbi:MAG: primosomal protein N' [Ruminococcaceae bacterium]|nr:primosomal protein N' [Oscillospiraceae bacterium]
MAEYAGLHILKSPYHIDNEFDYFLPPHLRDEVRVGDFVTVPFGTANTREIALVVSLKASPSKELQNYKPIISVCDKRLSLSEEMLGLCFFMKEQTLCTVGDAVRSMLPSAALTKPHEIYKCTDTEPNRRSLDSVTLFILDYIRKKKKVDFENLKSHFGPAAKPTVKKLIETGLIEKDYEIRESAVRYERSYKLAVDTETAKQIKDRTDTVFRLRSAAHISIVSYLLDKEGMEISEKQLTEDCAVTYTQLKALCDKGILEKISKQVDRSLPLVQLEEYLNVQKDPIKLNDEQSTAFETLRQLADSGEPKAALLFGVTGSGKTSVMMKTIDHVLEQNKSVIVLLPEISLTPQTLDIFCSRYGNEVAIIHSGLSDGERLDTHRRIKRGEVKVVIGTRSAVFAPLDDLGMIIIDEEQEHTYKSDQDPKYHARDIARYRVNKHSALLLLASATPSFESYTKAIEGKYTLVQLKSRYGNAKLPRVSVVDMRKNSSGTLASPLGNALCERLVENKQKNEQSILFINRRGYNSFVSCRSCGEAVSCPTCSVSMTYHTLPSSYEQGELRCHWCGRRMPLPKVCPSCESEHISRMGYGTQRIEQELGTLLPDSTILRMDTDTTGTKNAYGEILGKFKRQEADVLLGTQMVTKGHDFPNVTLVGVMLADASLYLDDYRAAERTFSMLTQVIGRAGRADKEGEAIIQTNNPDNECIRLACEQNYEKFYKNEIRLRKQLKFPPFCDIALLSLSSADEKELLKASKILSEKFSELVSKEYSDIPIMTFGPFEAPVYKVDNKYRMRMVIKCKLNKRSRAMFSELLCDFSRSGAKGLTLSIDFNPSTL